MHPHRWYSVCNRRCDESWHGADAMVGTTTEAFVLSDAHPADASLPDASLADGPVLTD